MVMPPAGAFGSACFASSIQRLAISARRAQFGFDDMRLARSKYAWASTRYCFARSGALVISRVRLGQRLVDPGEGDLPGSGRIAHAWQGVLSGNPTSANSNAVPWEAMAISRKFAGHPPAKDQGGQPHRIALDVLGR